jgi:hypothetical protein
MNATLMKIADLLQKYGDNFFTKCPEYKTAYYDNCCVRLVKYNPENLTFAIESSTVSRRTVAVTELNDFCL